jgi:dolichol-phosphate mannosyltransferase
VVDDASPDGTAALAASLGAEVLQRRRKAGLAAAYKAGFAHALMAGAGFVVQMDADLSHDPADVPRLLAAAGAVRFPRAHPPAGAERSPGADPPSGADHSPRVHPPADAYHSPRAHPPADAARSPGPHPPADLVIGSRYVPGGGVAHWRAWRRAVSRAACGYARAVLRVPVRDLTSGFKCWRADALHTVDFGGADSQGYAFQVELTYRALRRGLRVAELPIVFTERREGRSKLSGRIALEAAWRVPALALRGRRGPYYTF